MKFVLFYLPTVGTKAQFEKGMAGINNQNYQNMLRQISAQVRAADEMGFYAVAFTEHHFHIEGFEASNNPLLLDLYMAMQTKYIKVTQLANVLTFQNPIRLAEDIAMIDHMTRGRIIVGIARGYQKRWADTLGQLYHVGATLSDKSEMDIRNRRIFEEHYRIMIKAWTEDTFRYEGEWWKIPPDDVDFNHEAVRKYGRGIDERGKVVEIGIAPKPYQKPYPPIWQPFSFSEETFRFCGREGIVPFMLNTDETAIRNLMTAYYDEAAKVGRQYSWGQNIGIFRDVLVAKTDEEAHQWASIGNGFVWPMWFGGLGFDEALRRQGESGSLRCQYPELVERGFEYVGSPDTVNRYIEDLVKKFNPEYLLMWQYPGLVPHEEQMRSLELFATEVMPNWMD
ncbi:LLM class flavin-dependent oxidoreductase [Kyrpidia tusciae]|uniref:Luciferase-like, subgroup n=1 Tax=Kyrpidia tusciae (strain DSM 2912 / NBRC 15312 / T2) TaxID=562970 RepID=D5WXU7_KYRT2|nr:LLM class flavin-dependent oxidoreductase [Kyrpidia tusciae]ADG06006.1 Luciferase-like, subgroup [Kyrpidia tusciae DSM 2912]